MAILTLEDLTGKSEAVLFPKSYEEYGHLLVGTTPLIISGSINERDDKRSLVISKIEKLWAIEKPKRLTISLIGISDQEKLKELKGCFTEDGETTVEILYGTKTKPQRILRKTNLDNYFIAECLEKWISFS
jgi:DNA polymerase III alpha subunit